MKFMNSRAALLKYPGNPLELGEIQLREPRGPEVLLRVKGAGVCRTDLRIVKGEEARPNIKLPMALGHENAGIIEAVGENVVGLNVGDAVAVYATWGCMRCRYCREGKYSLCKEQEIPGQTTHGGYSQFMLVPSFTWLVKLGGLDPVSAAPLADAGTTSMGAVRKVSNRLGPNSTVVVYGAGGVALYLIQVIKALHSNVKVIAVSRSEERRMAASRRGADLAIHPKDLVESVRALSSEDAQVAFDVVGDEKSTALLSQVLSSDGEIVLVGLEGKSLSLPTFETVVWEHKVLGSNYGTLNDLEDVITLAREGKVSLNVRTYPLEEVNEALSALDRGEVVDTRLVVVP